MEKNIEEIVTRDVEVPVEKVIEVDVGVYIENPVFEEITEIWLLIPTTAPVSLIHTVIFPQQLIFR